MQVLRFAASWSSLTMLITVLVILLAVVVAGISIKAADTPDQDTATRTILFAVAMGVPVILLTCVVFAPLGYVVDETGVVVNRIGPKVLILRSEIAEIRWLTKSDVGFSLRFWGSGGFFGFYGWFWSTRLGRHRAYITNAKELVLIQCHDGRKFLLSPSPADVFVATLQQACV